MSAKWTAAIDVARAVIAWLDLHSGLITALATVAIGFFTYFLVRVSNRQAKLTREAIALGNKEFITSHRPKIVIRHVRFADDGFHVGAPLRIGFQFWNAGDSAAHIKVICADIVIRGPTEELSPRFGPENLFRPQGLVIEPGDGDLYEAASAEPFSTTDQYRLGQMQRFIFLVGYIIYEDAAGGTRQKGFCRQHILTENRFAVVENSDYENND